MFGNLTPGNGMTKINANTYLSGEAIDTIQGSTANYIYETSLQQKGRVGFSTLQVIHRINTNLFSNNQRYYELSSEQTGY